MSITQRQHGARESLRGRTFMRGICMQIYAYATYALTLSICADVITDNYCSVQVMAVSEQAAIRIAERKRMSMYAGV